MKNLLKNKVVIIGTILCLLPIIFGIIYYNKLPDNIPTRFGFDGQVNGYTQKTVFVFAFPIAMALLNMLMAFVINTDPKRKNFTPAMKKISLLVLPISSIFISLISYSKALGNNDDINRYIFIFLGAMILTFGIYMPKTKRNYTMGIKLPWTMDNDYNWDMTHKLASKLWIVGGIALALNTFFRSLVLFVIIMVVITLVPAVYSFMLYKKGNDGTK